MGPVVAGFGSRGRFGSGLWGGGGFGSTARVFGIGGFVAVVGNTV